MSDTMQYWNNGDGTFTVRAYEVTYSDNTPSKLVYTHAIAYREWTRDNGDTMTMRLLTRDHRPAIGVEIPVPGSKAYRLTAHGTYGSVSVVSLAKPSDPVEHLGTRHTIECIEAERTTSGYTPCACRDCMDIAITGDDNKPALCLLCKDEGCEICYQQALSEDCTAGHSHECQRDDAYGSDCA